LPYEAITKSSSVMDPPPLQRGFEENAIYCPDVPGRDRDGSLWGGHYWARLFREQASSKNRSSCPHLRSLRLPLPGCWEGTTAFPPNSPLDDVPVRLMTRFHDTRLDVGLDFHELSSFAVPISYLVHCLFPGSIPGLVTRPKPGRRL
jgi:hypothetical protein